MARLNAGGEVRERVFDAWVADLYPAYYHSLPGDRPGRALDGPLWLRFDAGELLNQDDVDALHLDVAFTLEQAARRVFAERQPTGGLAGRALVWDTRSAAKMRRALAGRPPSPAIREPLRRAFAWWQAALDAGLELYDADAPGQERITYAFKEFGRYEKRLPKIDPQAHGVAVHADPFHVRPEERLPQGTDDRAFSLGWLKFVAVLALAILSLLPAAVQRCTPSPARSRVRPPDCAKLRADALDLARRVEARSPERGPLLAEIRGLIDAGETAEAHRRWEAATRAEAGAGTPPLPGEVDLEEAGERLLGTQLFILQQCRRPTQPG
ncbi:MAG: hypothetical protein R3A79_18575 [Nannocystaceae bacterium]